MTCSTCRFSDVQVIDTVGAHGEAQGELPHLVCRRFPPTPVAQGDAAAVVWPLVHDQEWCGEFREAPGG